MTDSPHPAPDPLAFTPVPGRARHDGWTPERQRRFIEALAAIGVVAAAARAVGRSATAAYKLRDRPGAAGLARAWDIAVQMGQDRAFGIAMDRAANGYEAPRYYAGRQVGTVRKFDYRLALAVLRAPRPPLTAGEQAEVDWLMSGTAPDAPITATADTFDNFGVASPTTMIALAATFDNFRPRSVQERYGCETVVHHCPAPRSGP